MLVLVDIIVANNYSLNSTKDTTDVLNNTEISFNDTAKQQPTTRNSGGSDNGLTIKIGAGIGGCIGGLIILCCICYCCC
jgi:hypothetical protein